MRTRANGMKTSRGKTGGFMKSTLPEKSARMPPTQTFILTGTKKATATAIRPRCLNTWSVTTRRGTATVRS